MSSPWLHPMLKYPFTETGAQLLTMSTRRIVSLVMQYTGVLEEERREALERLQAENHKCDADLELVSHRHRLCLLFARVCQIVCRIHSMDD